jgi:hypothetical protein
MDRIESTSLRNAVLANPRRTVLRRKSNTRCGSSPDPS